MNAKNFFIGTQGIWIVTLSGMILALLGAFQKVQHDPWGNLFLFLGLVLSLTSWVLILRDMFQQNIKHKNLWIIGMFVSGSVVSFMYLFLRDRQLIESKKTAL